MMDRDFPINGRLTLVALVAAGAVGVALFGGYLPGLHPDYGPAGIETVDGHSYYYDTIVVPFPPIGSNTTSPEPHSFHNVTFWIWVTDWYSITGGELHGNATLANSSAYPFEFQGSEFGTGAAQVYLAPGGSVGAAWNGGVAATLLVEV